MNALIYICLVGLFLPVFGQESSPCPDIFQYNYEGDYLYGSINIPPSDGYLPSVLIRTNFTVATQLPSNYVGRLQPVSSDALKEFNRGNVLRYRVHFPVVSPVPRLTAITVNGNLICYGPGDQIRPGTYVTAISLQHMLFMAGYQNQYADYRPRPSSNVQPSSQNQPVYYDFLVSGDINRDGELPSKEVFPNQYNEYAIRPMNDVHQPTYLDRPNPSSPQSQRPEVIYNYIQPSDGDKYVGNWNTVTSRPNFEQPATRPQSFADTYPEPVTVAPRPKPVPRPRPQEPAPRPPEPVTRPPPPPEPAPTPQPSLPSSSVIECGIVAGGNERIPLVYNGQGYDRGDWPWLVAIYKQVAGTLTFSCAGTLVSNRHVVTAAHCMQQQTKITSVRDFVIKVGAFNLEKDWGEEITLTRTLHRAVIHEAYNSSTLANDILIMTFERSVEFNAFIRPACLWEGVPDLSFIVGASGVVAGWGQSEQSAPGHGPPRMVRVPIVSTATCRASKPDFHKLTSVNTLCAGDRNGSGPCLGDSGGGLYVLDSGRWRLRGVVSVSLRPENGDNTCNLNEYIVFTDAAQYLPWIQKVMAEA